MKTEPPTLGIFIACCAQDFFGRAMCDNQDIICEPNTPITIDDSLATGCTQNPTVCDIIEDVICELNTPITIDDSLAAGCTQNPTVWCMDDYYYSTAPRAAV